MADTIPAPKLKCSRSEDAALSLISEVVEAISQEYCEGGHGAPWPGVSEIVGDCVVFADLDHDDAPTLEIYPAGYCMEWIAEAYELKREYPKESAIFWWEESRPSLGAYKARNSLS